MYLLASGTECYKHCYKIQKFVENIYSSCYHHQFLEISGLRVQINLNINIFRPYTFIVLNSHKQNKAKTPNKVSETCIYHASAATVQY